MNPQMFQTLGEPNRLHIVELLLKHPATVGNIADALHMRQPQASKHLKVLAKAEIVEVHPMKNKRMYALRSQPFQELDKWLEKYRKTWNERLDRLDELLQEQH